MSIFKPNWIFQLDFQSNIQLRNLYQYEIILKCAYIGIIHIIYSIYTRSTDFLFFNFPDTLHSIQTIIIMDRRTKFVVGYIEITYSVLQLIYYICRREWLFPTPALIIIYEWSPRVSTKKNEIKRWKLRWNNICKLNCKTKIKVSTS